MLTKNKTKIILCIALVGSKTQIKIIFKGDMVVTQKIGE